MASNPLILASTSATRRALLSAAGVTFEARPAEVDEKCLQDELKSFRPENLALELAKAKALSLSALNSSHLILGADQILVFSGKVIHKAHSLREAHETLSLLRGETHQLHSAIAFAAGSKLVFEHISTAHLTMRNFSEEFLEHYLETVGEDILGSVGCYHYEGLGLQLFEKIEGDYHTILGLPLLPVLAFLRQSSILPA